MKRELQAITVHDWGSLFVHCCRNPCLPMTQSSKSIPRKKVLLSAVDDRWSQVQSYKQLHSHLKSHAGLSHELGEDGVATFCAMFRLGLLLVHMSMEGPLFLSACLPQSEVWQACESGGGRLFFARLKGDSLKWGGSESAAQRVAIPYNAVTYCSGNLENYRSCLLLAAIPLMQLCSTMAVL